MEDIRDGNYIFVVEDDGKLIDYAHFSIENNTISYTDKNSEMALGDRFPAGRITPPIKSRIQKYLNFDHHRNHLEFKE